MRDDRHRYAPVTVLQYDPKTNGMVFNYKATFIKWGLDYTEFESGPGPYTCAIVEKEDGQVVTLHPNLIKFDPDFREIGE